MSDRRKDESKAQGASVFLPPIDSHIAIDKKAEVAKQTRPTRKNLVGHRHVGFWS